MSDDVSRALHTWGRMTAADLRAHLQVSRATLMRAIKPLGNQVVTRGKARRTACAARSTSLFLSIGRWSTR